MSLNVLAIADAVSVQLYDYFCPARWQDVDLVVSAGDLSPDYLDFLASTLNVPLFYVRGNHDGKYRRERYDGFENIHGRIVEYRGLRIAGFEGSRRYNGGTCQYTETEMRRKVLRSHLTALRCGAPDIILTHAPPARCHDAEDVCHRGFECFHEAINWWRPSYLIHGHMHNYTGGPAISQIGSTTVVNAFGFRRVEVPEAVMAEASPQAVPKRQQATTARRIIGKARIAPIH